jgi:hypothetical protein
VGRLEGIHGKAGMAGLEKGRGPARATATHLLELGAGPAMASDRESRERKKNKNGAAAWREQNTEGRRKASHGRELGDQGGKTPAHRPGEEGAGAPRHCWPRGGRALLLGASQRWKKGSAAMGGRKFLRAEQRKELCVRERGRRESGG